MSTLQVSNIIGPTTIDATTANATSLAVTGGASIYRKTNTGNVDNSLTLGTTNKSSTPSNYEGYVHIKSNDATNQLRGWMRLVTDSTQANRRLAIDAYEDNVAARNITLAENGGKVGIGTANPGQKLSIVGSVGDGITYTDGTVTNFIGTGTGSFGQIGTITNHPTQLLTNSLVRLHVDTSGNVGIGTLSPFGKLHVAGYMLLGPVDTTTTYQGMSIRNGKDSSVADTTSYIDTHNNLGIADSNMFFCHQTDGGSYILFSTTPPGSRSSDRRIERMRIDSSGNMSIANTSSYGARLHVYNLSSSFDINVAGSSPSIMSSGGWGGGIGLKDGTYTAGMFTENLGATLRFYTSQGSGDTASSKVKMSIDGAGRVFMPYQPFAAGSSSYAYTLSNSTFNNGFDIVYNNVDSNVGNHYNNSTGIFTAPVTGTYLVMYTALLEVGTSSSVDYRLSLSINGGQTMTGSSAKGNGYPSLYIHTIVGVAAGDTIKARFWNDSGVGGSHADANYTRFSIRFLG
jgi:hypothetical protein